MRILGRLLLLAACTTGCDDSATVDADSAFVLVSVDGERVPAEVERGQIPGAPNPWSMRVVGGSVVMISSDSAWYTHATNVTELLPDGSKTLVSTSCTSVLVGYRRAGQRVFLDRHTILPPSQGFAGGNRFSRHVVCGRKRLDRSGTFAQ